MSEDQNYREELYKKVNDGRKEIDHQILTKDLLDELSIEELEEEIRMISLCPKVDKLLKEAEELTKKYAD